MIYLMRLGLIRTDCVHKDGFVETEHYMSIFGHRIILSRGAIIAWGVSFGSDQ